MRLRPLFPPRNGVKTKGRFHHKGKQKIEHDTVNGVVSLERIYWWSGENGRDDTVDRLIGIVAGKVSIGVRQMCCRAAVSQQGFAGAAEHLKHLAQVIISRERLRQIVESEGQLVLDVQEKGLLSAGFDIEQCRISRNGIKRVYVGTDGVKVPMVTQVEKDKRRKTSTSQVWRRQTQANARRR